MSYDYYAELTPHISYRVWGSERKTHDGYIWVYFPGHPRANAIGEVPKHTLVLEEKIGRYLAPNEVAHHINHVRDDNRPENLKLMDANAHKWMHIWEARKKRQRLLAKRPKKEKPPKLPNPNAPKPWTQAENDLLLANWQRFDDQELANQIGRTKVAVFAHRTKLGLIGKPGKSGARWLPQQEQYIRDMWGQRTLPEIAEFLGRTITATKLKAKRLGLRAQIGSGDLMTAGTVATVLGVDGHTVCDYWMVKCGLHGWARTLGNGDRTVMIIRRPDLLRWLKEHQDLWESNRLEPNALWRREPAWLKAKREADAKLPARRREKWTPEDDAALLELLATRRMTYLQLGEALDRSERSIIQRLRHIGAGGLREWRARL